MQIENFFFFAFDKVPYYIAFTRLSSLDLHQFSFPWQQLKGRFPLGNFKYGKDRNRLNVLSTSCSNVKPMLKITSSLAFEAIMRKKYNISDCENLNVIKCNFSFIINFIDVQESVIATEVTSPMNLVLSFKERSLNEGTEER